MVSSSFLLLVPALFRNLIIEVTLLFVHVVEAFQGATALIMCLQLSRWSRNVCTNKSSMSRKQFARACTVFWWVSLWWKESYTAEATSPWERTRGFLRQPKQGYQVGSLFTVLLLELAQLRWHHQMTVCDSSVLHCWGRKWWIWEEKGPSKNRNGVWRWKVEHQKWRAQIALNLLIG